VCDCAYDEETNYFYRADNKYLLPHLLLFRFWQYQTGSGCILNHANFEKLESILAFRKQQFEKDSTYQREKTKKFNRNHKPGQRRDLLEKCDSNLLEDAAINVDHVMALEKFLQSFQNQVKTIESCHLTIQVNSEEGPSIGDAQIKTKKRSVFI
jgi:hypothetical protein